MGGGGRGAKHREAEEDEGELSDTTRAVRRIQRELEGGGDEEPAGDGRRGSGRRSTRDELDEPLGDGKERGAVTGIKLGEFAPGARRQSGGFSFRGKDGKDRTFGQGLESLANRADSDEEARAMPAAPEGSFRRRDVERPTMTADERGRPKAQLGLDGKVWAFVEGPGGEEDEDSSEEGRLKRKADQIAEDARQAKAKQKEKSKDKKKGKDKKDKKSKKKKKKAKAKKKKKKKDSSRSSSDSSGSSS
mmetsp:Transcript_90973/g.266380  ORF Transcript_90973/g.266380 Transcript_90973/m.266380 type:complete len:247 (-) Transcript_90973:149-889(-)